MGTADNIPGNNNTNELDLNNGGWIIIAILICIIVILAIVLIISHYKAMKKADLLQRNAKTDLTEREFALLNQYRKLDPADKTNVDNLISSLNKPPKI